MSRLVLGGVDVLLDVLTKMSGFLVIKCLVDACWGGSSGDRTVPRSQSNSCCANAVAGSVTMFADPEVVGKIQLESAYLVCFWFLCLEFRDPCLGTKVSGWNPPK